MRITRSDGPALAALPDTAGIKPIEGDGAEFDAFVSLLDLDVTGFRMHQR